jgi:signal recognition particle receptor subunit beta
MVLFNYATKELTAKVVYYGPGLCGKTTNLQFIHQNLPETVKGKMLSLATKTDRTLFFDFLPLDLGDIRGMKTRVQLYTVPGQVFYNETRKLVLKGVDGVVFVADSQKEMLGPNAESFKNLEENLKGHGLSLAELPHVIQFNKRDLPKLASIEEINEAINRYNAPFYESVATTGIGVKDSLNAITKLVLLNLTRKYSNPNATADTRPAAPAPAPVASVPLAASSGSTPSSDPPPPVLAAPPPTPDEPAAPPVDEVHAVTIGSTDDLPETAPAPAFGADQLDDLIDEVQAAQAPMPEPPTPMAGDATPSGEESMPTEDLTPSEEIIPPEELVTTTHEPPSMVEERPVAEPEQTDTSSPTEITLTEVAGDDELFNDPSLEVARMAAGEAREIIIPVEVGDERTGMRRYKLALKLRLDPVD